MENTIEQNKPRRAKLPRGYLPAWSTRGVSLAVSMILLMQIVFFATESLRMDAAFVGALLLASRVFDGFTDLIAGFFIDRTRTRFGKGRPYELMIVPIWIFLIMLFSASPEWSAPVKAAYLLVLYSLITGLFQTFMATAEGVFMHRSLKEGELQAKVAAITGLIVMLFGAVASTLLPRLMNTWGKEPGGWTKIALVYGVPMTVIGLGRFFFIKETEAPDTKEQQFGLIEGLKIMVKSKYVFIFAGASLLVNIVNNMSSTMGSYYFTYVIGNLDLMSIMGISSLLAPFFLLLFPLAMRTIGGMGFIRIGLIVAALGNLIKLFAPTNLAVVVIGTMLSGIGANTLTMISGIFIIECMDHLEWKSGKRLEGMAGIVPNLAGKVGSGIGPAIAGLLLSFSGYAAGAAVQTDAALQSIIALYSWIPAVMCAVSLVIACFYDLDKKIYKIREDLSAGKTAPAGA